jgi:hypothetical protein
MVRLCWVLAVASACSSGNARRPAGPPPVYEPRPVMSYVPNATAEPDPLDALLDGPEPGASEGEPAVNSTEPVEAQANPASSALADTAATTTTSLPTTAATAPAPVNPKP